MKYETTEVLTLDEVAEYLKISKSTLDRIRRNHKNFPEVKLGDRLIRVPKKELLEWLEINKI